MTFCPHHAYTSTDMTEGPETVEKLDEENNDHDLTDTTQSTPLSDHGQVEPAPIRGKIEVTFTRFNKGHDPYVAAVSDDAYLPPHHNLTLASKATRLGQSLYHAGARSFQGGINDHEDDARRDADRASIKTVISVHMPRWMRDFTARRSHQQSIVPLLVFNNPWRSFKPPGIATAVQGGLRWGLPKGYVEGGTHKSKYRARGRSVAQSEQEAKQLDVSVLKPEWDSHDDSVKASNIRITWLGHATTLVQLPNGLNILFDPIFVQRASPSQSAGPYRFTSPPCKVEELPDIDVVCISHNHYDHLSWDCMKKLRKRQKLRGGMKVFCPLGNVGFFREAGFAKEDVCEMDWWDQAKVERTAVPGWLQIVCTPAQHGSGRSGSDQNISLWSSWLVRLRREEQDLQSEQRVYFAGDTGLRSRSSHRKPRSEYPVCPTFREISLRFGVPQVLLLPISVGSSLSFFRSWDPFPRRYSPFPRIEPVMTSAIHFDPVDAADCHMVMSLGAEQSQEAQEARQAVQRQKHGVTSIAVHFGTFVRNEEQTRADVRELRNACRERDIRFVRSHDEDVQEESKDTDKTNGRFIVSNQGQCILIPVA
jgi:L-ascorbate metabolism protein UlaG (beta-lactamase superfamily)